ncbi:chorismate lyase [Pasteurellaceae bacterium HPA106]|uniref:chorismate--pyruvate lyase family protein n=1 Tax=Spirabiliibacterium pneumoniae TaxID=221400 RepID=UPI001AAD3124|nr:chorismate lyase [Spirabiliibacterium pneumoniae]MBE2896856.1 chorismate lyase [Spirabiliibacterium pneumoniae]
MAMFNSFTHIHWQAHNIGGDALPCAVQHWLFSTPSLTALLKQKCGQFTVDVRCEGWQRAILPQETALLPKDKKYWVREVTLLGDGTPWVAARTVIPLTTSEHFPPLLALNTTPLGEFLFQHNSVRGALQWGRIESMYARRSCFMLAHQSLLVSELFLPEFDFTA